MSCDVPLLKECYSIITHSVPKCQPEEDTALTDFDSPDSNVAGAWIDAGAWLGAGAWFNAGAWLAAGAWLDTGAWLGAGSCLCDGSWLSVAVWLSVDAWLDAGVSLGAGSLLTTTGAPVGADAWLGKSITMKNAVLAQR